MARGAQKAAEDMSKSGYNTAQEFNTQQIQGNAQLQNYLIPQYQNLVNNPGFDQATKNAITQNSEGASAATYASANDALARRAARTGNTAGEVAGMDKLAQEKAQTMSGVAANNQIQFANRAKADVSEGLQGMSGLYGMDTNLLAKSLGIPPEYLQQYNEAASRPSFGQQYLLGAQKAATQLAASGGG
jgi:hypothetical protein